MTIAPQVESGAEGAPARIPLSNGEQDFRSIIENISDTITIVDAAGFIEYQSPSVQRVLGYRSPPRRTHHFAQYVHPEDLPAARELFTTQLKHPGERGTLDARVRHRDGSWRWLSMVATARKASDGRVSLIVNGRDVTEQRLLLAQLEQANRVNSLGRLAATVAHEFNNVLMGMQPFAELIGRPAASQETVAKAAGYILSSIARGKRVALDILRFTQPASPAFAAVDLAHWWTRLLPELQAGTGNSIAFEWSIPEGLVATADAVQLAQALSNLVSNAREAMPHGGRLTVTARRPAPGETFAFGVVERPEDFVQISVADTGAGMTEEVAAQIFEPLFTTKRTGTGLGLTVVHQVVRRHGGSIFVSTRPREGTTFHLFIPTTAPLPYVRDAQEPQQRLQRMQILVADDEDGVADGVAACLEADGASVRTAKTGAELVAAIEKERPRVAVIDVKLPDGDGIEIGRRLRCTWPDLRIVYVSGHADSRRIPPDHPYEAFLQKPFAVSTLIAEIVRRAWGADSPP